MGQTKEKLTDKVKLAYAVHVRTSSDFSLSKTMYTWTGQKTAANIRNSVISTVTSCIHYSHGKLHLWKQTRMTILR